MDLEIEIVLTLFHADKIGWLWHENVAQQKIYPESDCHSKK